MCTCRERLAAATSTVEGAADLKFLLLKILKLFFSSNKLDKLTALGLLTDGSNVNKTIGSKGYKQKIHEVNKYFSLFNRV